MDTSVYQLQPGATASNRTHCQDQDHSETIELNPLSPLLTSTPSMRPGPTSALVMLF